MASISGMEPLTNLLYERLRLKFHLWDWPEHEGFNPDPKWQNEGDSREYRWNLSFMPGRNFIFWCYFQVTHQVTTGD